MLTKEELLAAAQSLGIENKALYGHPPCWREGKIIEEILTINVPSVDKGGWVLEWYIEDSINPEIPTFISTLSDSDVVIRALILKALGA